MITNPRPGMIVQNNAAYLSEIRRTLPHRHDWHADAAAWGGRLKRQVLRDVWETDDRRIVSLVWLEPAGDRPHGI